MLRLPTIVEVQLQDIGGRQLGAADILIAINLYVNGQYYYGNLVGLTNASGGVHLERDELDLRFAADRALFPMDYKVDLEECDPTIELLLLTDDDIVKAQSAFKASPFVNEAIRAMYDTAKNSQYRTALSRVWADLPGSRQVRVILSTSSVGVP